MECLCPEAIIKERLERRAMNVAEASDGRREIYEAQKNDFDEITEFVADIYLTVDTSRTLQECTHQVIEQITKR